MTTMFTRQDLIDAIGGMMTDVEAGAWGLDDDCMHPAIVPLLDQLPDDGETRGYETRDIRKGDFLIWANGGFDGRRALSDAFELRPGQWAVVMPGPGGDYPPCVDSHVLRCNVPPEIAAILDPQPEAPKVDDGAHPDVIDRDGDRYTWSTRHSVYLHVATPRGTSQGYASREALAQKFGPVRDA